MTTDAQLRSVIERIEALKSERQSISEAIREVFAEAKSNGYDAAAIREVIRIRAANADAERERDALVTTYLNAIRG